MASPSLSYLERAALFYTTSYNTLEDSTKLYNGEVVKAGLPTRNTEELIDCWMKDAVRKVRTMEPPSMSYPEQSMLFMIKSTTETWEETVKMYNQEASKAHYQTHTLDELAHCWLSLSLSSSSSHRWLKKKIVP